jgi:DNA-directed RNA polymerase subunit RPC12/RpoP
MKIDWGRVPKGTLFEVTYNDGRKSIRYFISLNNNYIKATEYSVDGDTYNYECSHCKLLLPEDIEKYAIKEEPRYVCPLCGEEVKQIVKGFFIIDTTLISEYYKIKCTWCKCGVPLFEINGHFGKKVEG